MNFKALLLQNDSGVVSSKIENVSKDTLLHKEGDTLIKVLYSSLNYKDALAITNTAPVVRSWPMIPGIDGVGEVISCNNQDYQPGDLVVLNGWGCGEKQWGCLSQYAYLKSGWLIPLPKNISIKQSMAIGTAGYTAGLCVLKIIEHGISPDDGNILISGASGGVGSIAILVLVNMGYKITALSSKTNNHDYLKKLGASDVLDAVAFQKEGKPLQKEQWAAAIDVLGGSTLSNICAQIKYNGIVAACGMAESLNFNSFVAPFILRGVTLSGVDSVMNTYENRVKAWNLISDNLQVDKLNNVFQEISLDECLVTSKKMMSAETTGRFIVNLW